MRKSPTVKSKKNGTITGHAHQGPFRVAACWPHQDAPLILAMLGDGRVVIATSMTPVNFEDLLDLQVSNLRDNTFVSLDASELPRWIFAVPYDFFPSGSAITTSERPIAWNIKAALIWTADHNEPKYVARADANTSRFHLHPSRELKSLLSDALKWIPTEPEPIELLPVTSDDSYLDAVRSIIDSIKNGDFYQVNLLRFFQSPNAGGWGNLCMRLETFAGPYGCLLTQGSRVLASFSPERFVEISTEKDVHKIETWPIKGTIARVSGDEKADLNAGQQLLNSEKDLAELRMIIDLMRNDLAKLCDTGSVDVISAGELKKFPGVWHLEGHVQGRLNSEITLRDVLQSLCPGGSITGAPKIAAMARIKSDEGQSRGFFMGNLFAVMHDGSIKSNILIRTIISDNWMRSARYAAGSGIVVKSNPDMELLEIKSKCSILTGVKS